MIFEQGVRLVLRAVCEIQAWSGRSSDGIDQDTRPLGDLDDFDSLNAEEVCSLLSEELEQEIPTSIFDQQSLQPATIGNIAQRLCEFIRGTKGDNRD
jgi:acyl carrier protein